MPGSGLANLHYVSVRLLGLVKVHVLNSVDATLRQT